MTASRVNRLSRPGESNGRAKMSRAQVEEARARYRTEEISLRKLAEDYEISYQQLWRAIHGVNWT